MSVNLWTLAWAKSKNIPTEYYPEITSTSDAARINFAGLNSKRAIFLSDHQTRGRGRYQRLWQDTGGGEVLLSTWCYRLETPPQPILTPLLGLAVYQSLKEGFGSSLPLGIKPPNDIRLNRKKLGGLLVEVVQSGHCSDVFIGLGMNVLGAPKVDVPTAALTDSVKVTEPQWLQVCDLLDGHFASALQEGTQARLVDERRQQLLVALNAELSQNEKYLDVSPACDLYTASGKVSWMDL